jgi:hypothetical protein
VVAAAAATKSQQRQNQIGSSEIRASEKKHIVADAKDLGALAAYFISMAQSDARNHAVGRTRDATGITNATNRQTLGRHEDARSFRTNLVA